MLRGSLPVEFSLPRRERCWVKKPQRSCYRAEEGNLNVLLLEEKVGVGDNDPMPGQAEKMPVSWDMGDRSAKGPKSYSLQKTDATLDIAEECEQ